MVELPRLYHPAVDPQISGCVKATIFLILVSVCIPTLVQKTFCVDYQDNNRGWSTAGGKIWSKWFHFQSSGKMEHAKDRSFKSANSDKTPLSTCRRTHPNFTSFSAITAPTISEKDTNVLNVAKTVFPLTQKVFTEIFQKSFFPRQKPGVENNSSLARL